jgi:hypothetical protein
MGSFWLTGLSYMVAPHWTGVQDLSRSTILWQDLLRKTLVPPLVPAQGALVACLTGPVTLTSTRTYDLHYSTYTHAPGSVSIHILRTVVLDYGELLAYWFIFPSLVAVVLALLVAGVDVMVNEAVVDRAAFFRAASDKKAPPPLPTMFCRDKQVVLPLSRGRGAMIKARRPLLVFSRISLTMMRPSL